MEQHDFTSRRLTVNGVETEVLEIGTGTPLVFLHGTGTFTGFEAAREWARTHRVVIPHHPNFGRSADRADYTSSSDYVLHYLDLLDALGLDRVDLAGFSLGGWIAAEVALHQPDRVAHLVLVAPAGLVDPAAPAPDLFALSPQQIPAYLAHDPARIMRFFPAAPDPAFDAALGREMGGLARLLAADPQGNPVLGRWLHRLRMPVLLLWGAEDRLRPAAQADAWLAGLPNGRKVLVPDAGHLLFEEAPEAARIVTDFLAEGSASAGVTRPPMLPGISRGAAAAGGAWHILGQTYTPLQSSEGSMAWHAVFPPGTFVPPHVHPTQDEFVYVLGGTYTFWLDGEESEASAGDLVRLAKGVPHGIFNRGTEDATSLFWVAPRRGLQDLFEKISGVGDPAEVVRLAALHEVHFLPPR